MNLANMLNGIRATDVGQSFNSKGFQKLFFGQEEIAIPVHSTGGCGTGSGVKMVNQLLAGVHIASSAEAMAFGAQLGLNTRMLFDVITNSSGTSCMFLKQMRKYLQLMKK